MIQFRLIFFNGLKPPTSWICLRSFFTLYHGKSPLNHHLGEYFLLVPSILSKSKKNIMIFFFHLQVEEDRILGFLDQRVESIDSGHCW